MSVVKAWKVLSEKVIDYRGPFRILSSVRQNPRNNTTIDFLRVECPDWAAVIPFTDKGEIVLVEQYRQGVDEVGLEIPAGVVDNEDSDFVTAASRELVEETGYKSDELSLLGVIHPNPSMMPVRCHIYVAKNCVESSDQELDHGEDIRVVLKKEEEVLEMIKQGKIKHSMVLSAFALLLLNQPPGSLRASATA